MLDRIGAIYAVEARATFAPITERVELRREATPLVDAFFKWAEATVAKLSAKSSLAGAFNYAFNRREALSRFLTNGRLEIDNNIAENAMRCIALGRKNHLFAGSDTGGDRAAAIYTIVQTTKLNGVNPEAYEGDNCQDRGRTSNQPDRRIEPWYAQAEEHRNEPSCDHN